MIQRNESSWAIWDILALIIFSSSHLKLFFQLVSYSVSTSKPNPRKLGKQKQVKISTSWKKTQNPIIKLSALNGNEIYEEIQKFNGYKQKLKNNSYPTPKDERGKRK